MAARLTKAELETLKELGSAAEIGQRIHAYSEAVSRLSEKYEELAAQHPRRWAALLSDGEICLGDTLEELLHQCDERKVDRASVAIRFLDPERQVVIV